MKGCWWHMAKKRTEELKPLRRFDFGLVAPKLAGLYFNVDRDLQRRARQALERGDLDAERCFALLNMMLRFAWNSYETVAYIAGDIPEDPRRKPNFVLVVPNINRQLMDILFSLAYMMDDFRPRSLAYQRAGWREFHEEIQHFKTHLASDPEWRLFFRKGKETLNQMAELFKITPVEQKKPALIPYWKTPYQLLEEQTACSKFLKYLEIWLYKDTSAQAHMSFGGLFREPLIRF
jgi:hypothetical protein